MDSNFRWFVTKKAKEDLERNINFLIENSDYPENSRRLAHSIESGIIFLSQFPYTGQVYEEDEVAHENIYRYSLRNGFVIFYQVLQKERTIIILRVLSSRQDQKPFTS
ncbi:type II toxin-antitoxin system RelE/ParE family toxin [Mobiluncus mulieris]|uniref:type II toxin-antitoxin system RelE/ParE family toxin n=1 Tax=Mobiluncus mulieris TaxID=2052 RepID=UPI0037CA3A2F|nr:type II toxin-antitoxin system RelE/ParE family toxin [Mobiluncus mulieris]